jgi:putative DNA primase/helicase
VEKPDIARIVAQADLPAIARAFTEVKQKGSEYTCRCPFHSPDNNPSCYLYHRDGKWSFKCFSCGEAGDSLDWIQKLEGVSVTEAAKRISGHDWPVLPQREKPKAPIPDRITSKPPADAGSPDMHIRALGEPSRIWPYRDSDGAVLGYVARYDVDGKKEIRCWTWGQRGDASPGWGCGHWNQPRPLYGLDRLTERATAAVLIVEGEKACDAGHALLGAHYVSISWPGGSNAWHKADWEPLRGRTVLLWPDNDDAGVKAMQKLGELLAAKSGLACACKLVDPNRMPDGWDIADAQADGWDTAKVIEWAKPRASVWPPERQLAAVPTEPEDPDEAPEGEFPEEATTEKPQKRKPPRLQVVGNTALAPLSDPEPAPIPLSEDAFAAHFADLHGENWRCVKSWGKWFNWDGEAWAEDRTDSRVEPMRQIYREAQYWPQASEVTAAAKRSIFGKQVPIYSALRLAGTDRRIRAEPDIWDADPWVLGVPGGAINLQTGSLVESAREHHITMRCSVAPERAAPKLWLELLKQWTGGDDEVIGFLRRYLGYALTGDSREQCMAFFYGKAQSGKGTILRTVSGILGSDGAQKFRSYHYEAPISTFMESRSERHSTELAAFYKKRLITSEEPSAGAKWDEGKLKWITGGSQITARFISQDNFSFTMTGKIIVAANHRPRLSTTDKAIRRRIMVIPFEHPVADEKRDNQLDEKIRAEWPRILHWIIEGCQEWQQSGLGLPERIAASTDDYLDSEDTMGAWIGECCDREGEAGGAELYENYSRWCEQQGEHKFSRRGWSNALIERGYRTRKGTAGSRLVVGLKAKSNGYEPPSIPYGD